MERIDGPADANLPLELIRNGMPVYDVNNEHVGKVEQFQPPAEGGTKAWSLEAHDLSPADVPEVVPGSVIASNFTGDVRPQAVGEESPAGIVANLFGDDQ